MKAACLICLLAGAGFAAGQGADSRITNGGGSAGVGIKPSDVKPQVTNSAVIKLGAARGWKSADGRELTAELVSWPLTGAAAAVSDPAKANFDIVRNGQIRLRREKTTFTLALDKLSEADRAYVLQVTEQVKKTRSAPAASPSTPVPPATK